MDYEQKYKEALERAEVIYQGSYKPDTAATIAETLQNVFPELKDSEDEKIRKEIIDFIDTTTIYSDERRNRWFSYLEKQGEKEMKFLITRTSQSSHYDTPPCEGARLVNTQPYKWGIGFETLDDFLAFCKKQRHPVIIGTPFDQSDYSDIELEIYDDYRE